MNNPNGPNLLCSSKPLQRLTTDAATLKALIFFTASGSTNIHEGLTWGWRTLSPISVFGDAVSYRSQTAKKIIVLMTDGMNTWTTNTRGSYNKSFHY